MWICAGEIFKRDIEGMKEILKRDVEERAKLKSTLIPEIYIFIYNVVAGRIIKTGKNITLE